MNKMETDGLSIPGVKLIKTERIYDNRGYFSEVYNNKSMAAAGLPDDFVQENRTFNKYGVVRGLHCQLAPYAQAKLVRCLRGKVFDVVVDVREGSPTFGEWLGVELSENDNTQLWVPVGCLHGFCTLEENSIVEFKCTRHWSPEHERGVIWNDRHLDIQWPLPHKDIIVAERENYRTDFSAVSHWFSY